MSKNNPKTCPLSSNFAFAIIALLAMGLLLYTTIEVFNCKQDIAQINDRIQNSPKLVSAHNEQKIEKQGKDDSDKSNSKKVEGECEKLIQSDPGIVYNSDGTIDTSKWTLYKNEKYGFELLIPDFMELSDTSCKPDEYCKYPEDFFLFDRVGDSAFFEENKNKDLFASISILVNHPYNDGTDYVNFKKIVFGKNSNIIGYIDERKFGNSTEYEEYVNGHRAHISLENKNLWIGGYIMLSTYDRYDICRVSKRKNEEMKLLFDTILASFDY